MTNILVVAYPGTGKTFIAENFKDVMDLEFQHYRYDYGQYKELPLEELKGRADIRTPRVEWPENFFSFLKQEVKKHKVVLVPFATSLLPILPIISDGGVRVIFAIPKVECLERLIETYKQRGNSDEFIERRKNDFMRSYEIIASSKFEKIYLDDGEFLLDGLEKIGIKLEKGKGFKNYK